MPMMRFSLVAWSHAGDTYPGTRDRLEMYKHQYGYPDSDPLILQLEAALQVVARMTVGAGKSMEQQQGQGGLRKGRSASAAVVEQQHSEPERQHSGFGPGACVDARWPGDPYGWHGGHMVQSFSNGTHEVVFDDGDRSSAVRHVRARDHSLIAMHAVRCAAASWRDVCST